MKKDGKYQFRSVSPGHYKVTVQRADGKTVPAQIIVVQVGTTTRVK
ncbi:MAG: carboxypeptidase-like regulatory domain-containing protein [Lysobacter sp.]|nr:carboxypeptidase-like regulatory domain-containing protein [Lysobacter sp.]